MALMFPQTDGHMLEHGGSLSWARRQFPDAPEPWIDLSTGINPHSYPQLDVPAKSLSRLPDPGVLASLRSAAARYYGVQSDEQVVAAQGSQSLLPPIAGLVEPGTTKVLGPTYREHARSAVLAGHEVTEVSNLDELVDADLAILVNPNNPDGRLHEVADLRALAETVTHRGGLLVVDEAFMDAVPENRSLCGEVENINLVVLRSFGKFFGLAGIRLGFAIAGEAIAARLAALGGPWPVSGPALEYGLAALRDGDWQATTRHHLMRDGKRLRTLLASNGLEIAGGTALFTLARHEKAERLFDRLGEAGILVRRFAENPFQLRFGLPGEETEWARLEQALGAWQSAGFR